MRDLSIYIHIPFCVRKCLYCDFLSFPMREKQVEEGKIESYLDLLKEELISESARYSDHRVISVFWGGGTPSLLPADSVCDIMDMLRRYYHISQDTEITMESNPGTVTADGLHRYITAGINRLSIGLQSTDDEELKRIGRIHDYQTFLETYRIARKAGFSNINIDLMAALPGQRVASYEQTLKRVTDLRPEHISAYSLILEEGTPLYEHQANYQFPTEDEDREMYLLTDACLSACGYHRYEISNYAREGYECRHNKVYWQRGDYVGFGLGAASMVQNVRWSNPAKFQEYKEYVRAMRRFDTDLTVQHPLFPGSVGESSPVETCEKTGMICIPERQILTRQEQMEEFMFLGLRMMCGVDRRKFAEQFGPQIEEVYGEVLDRLYGQKLLVREADHIRLTARGIDVSNYVMSEFLF